MSRGIQGRAVARKAAAAAPADDGSDGGGGGVLCAPGALFELTATLAGLRGRRALLDGPLAECAFNAPAEGCLLPGGGLLVADTGNNALRFIARGTEAVSTLVGAPWLAPRSPICTRDGGMVAVCDSGHNKVRLLELSWGGGGAEDGPPGHVYETPLAGRGPAGHVDGDSAEAEFNGPAGLACLPDGSLLVADTRNNCVRRIAPRRARAGCVVSTIAGEPGAPPGRVDGVGRAARCVLHDRALHSPIAAAGAHARVRVARRRFSGPVALAVDASGVVLVADAGNDAVG